MATGEANGSDPIYHLFIDAACKLGEKVSFIHPARFLFNAGKTPKDWNEKMLNDEHYKVVQYWANSGDVFPTVDIKGGVAVTHVILFFLLPFFRCCWLLQPSPVGFLRIAVRASLTYIPTSAVCRSGLPQ